MDPSWEFFVADASSQFHVFSLRPSGSMTPWKVSCGEQKISKTGRCHPKKKQCTMSFITQLQLTTHSQTNVQYVRFLWDILVIVASKTWLQYSGTCRMRNREMKRGDGGWPSPGNLIYIYI